MKSDHDRQVAIKTHNSNWSNFRTTN